MSAQHTITIADGDWTSTLVRGCITKASFLRRDTIYVAHVEATNEINHGETRIYLDARAEPRMEYQWTISGQTYSMQVMCEYPTREARR